ncbi:MAG: hypothetical protein R3B98_06560 [Hyphomonas sp.]
MYGPKIATSGPYPCLMRKDCIRLNEFARLEYRDPNEVLKNFRSLELRLMGIQTDEHVMRLRTGGLKSAREMRLAALFCAGMTSLAGIKIWFADVENQDFDFVTMWVSGDTQSFAPVQLKEVVPQDLNPNASINDVFRSLRRYSDPSDLVVVVGLSQETRFDPATVDIPEDLNLGELWIFGALTPDHSKWGLWGDFTKGTVDRGHVFEYPT